MLASFKRELLYVMSYKNETLTIYTVDMKKMDSRKELISIKLPKQPKNFQISISEKYIGFLSPINKRDPPFPKNRHLEKLIVMESTSSISFMSGLN